VNYPPERNEERLAKRALFLLAWLAPCLILLLVMLQRDSGKLSRADSFDAAQTARQISHGHGFSTKFLRPLSLAVRPARAGENYPDLYQPPLYPLVLGLVFTVLPDQDQTVIYLSAACFFFTLLALFFLGRRLFGEKVAGLSVLLLGVNYGFLELGTSGSPLTLWVLLVALVLLLLHKTGARSEPTFWPGVIFGLSVLTEYASLLLLPGLLWYVIATREKKWRAGGIFLLGALLPLIPWGIRNTLVAGTPWFTLRLYTLQMFTPIYPGSSLLREASLPPQGGLAFIFSHLGLMRLKLGEGLRGLYVGLPVFFGIYVLPFFIAGMLLPLADAALRRLRGALYLMLLFTVLGTIFTTGAADFGAALVPPITLFAGAFFRSLLAPQPGKGKRARFAIGVLLLAAALPVILRLLGPPQTRGPERGDLQMLNQILPEKAVVLSDTPWAVAWYTDHTSIWLPNAPVIPEVTVSGDPTQSPNYLRLEQESPAVDAIYLTPSGLASYSSAEKLTLWQALRAAPPGFKVEAQLPQHSILLVKATNPASPPAGAETPPPAPGVENAPTSPPAP